MWIPYILDRIVVRGLMGAMADPARNDKQQSPWAQRLYLRTPTQSKILLSLQLWS